MSSSQLILATSIPPKLRGQPFGRDFCSSLQGRIINSWRQHGFLLSSLHTSTELLTQPDHAALLAQNGVQMLAVHQPSADQLPNLLASLKVLVATHPNDLLAITNADIYFSESDRLSAALKSMGHDQVLVGRRTNVAPETLDELASSYNSDIYGFDFFAFHATSLSKALPLIPEDLVFGRPWWDLFLPLALLSSGLQLRDPGKNLFLHPNHEDRWSTKQWCHYGYQADRRFLQLLREQSRDDFAQKWRRLRRSAIRRWPGLTGLRHRFREQRQALLHEGRILPLYLSDVSDAINTFVEAEIQL